MAVTAEATDTTLSADLLRLMIDELERYPDDAVALALRRCGLELKGKLRLPDIIQRIPCSWPSPDEAWANAIDACDENATVVWCDEISDAFFIAKHLLDVGDKFAARQAFVKAYERAVGVAQAEGRTPVWMASIGRDASMRRDAIELAVRNNKLPASWLKQLPPPDNYDPPLLEGGGPHSLARILDNAKPKRSEH